MRNCVLLCRVIFRFFDIVNLNLRFLLATHSDQTVEVLPFMENVPINTYRKLYKDAVPSEFSDIFQSFTYTEMNTEFPLFKLKTRQFYAPIDLKSTFFMFKAVGSVKKPRHFLDISSAQKIFCRFPTFEIFNSLLTVHGCLKKRTLQIGKTQITQFWLCRANVSRNMYTSFNKFAYLETFKYFFF